jgi:hypothetical protein
VVQLDLPLLEVVAKLLVLVVNHRPIVHPPHRPEDSARVVLEHCPAAVKARKADTEARTGAPLIRLLPSILQVWTDGRRNPRTWTPER